MPTAISLALGATLTIPANKNRVGITFLQSAVAATTFMTVDVNGIISFIVVGGTGPIRHFTLVKHGDLPMARFLLTGGSAVTFTGLTIEYFLPEDYLTAGLDEFKRRYNV